MKHPKNKRELAGTRNFAKGRLYYILNNLKTFPKSEVLTPLELHDINVAIRNLELVTNNWSEANQHLGLKK